MSVQLDSVANTRRVEMAVAGPGNANRLFVLAGMAAFQVRGHSSDWRKDSVSFSVGNTTLVPQQVVNMVATASLAGIPHGGAGWAVDNVTAHLDAHSHQIMLQAQMAVRDTDGFMLQMAYHVTVLARV
ncbi:MAG TPA: hypothetical protein VGK74_08825 [Symbiobacteriaceae bacterium]|jgi:hypothetical protein